MVLTYLLARAGLEVTLLEARQDFDRRFRGDSLHPATLELLDQVGLADDLLRLPHAKARQFTFHTARGTYVTADYGLLATRFNYVGIMPQAHFLSFLAERVQALPTGRVLTGTRVSGPLEEAGSVRGVAVRTAGGGEQTIPARLVVGFDGRSSSLRRFGGFDLETLGHGNDVLWFDLPREEADPEDADLSLYFGSDHYVALISRPDAWQVGYVIRPGGYPEAREAGVGPIRDFVSGHVPWLAARVAELREWRQVTLLNVEIARVPRWHRDGLLLLGDAAHVISPVGGNGILMAIQDSIVAANHLIPALFGSQGQVTESVLAEIQAEREPAIRKVQAEQVRTEARTRRLLTQGKPLAPDAVFRLLGLIPGLRRRAAHHNGYGPGMPRFDRRLLDRSASRSAA